MVGAHTDQCQPAEKSRRRMKESNVFHCLGLDVQQCIASFLPVATCIGVKDLRKTLACPFPYVKLHVHTTTDIRSTFCSAFFELLVKEQDRLREIAMDVRFAGAEVSAYFAQALRKLLENKSLLEASINIGVVDASFFDMLTRLTLPNGNFKVSCRLQLGESQHQPHTLSFTPGACEMLTAVEYTESVPLSHHLCSILKHTTKLKRLLINLRCCTRTETSKAVCDLIAEAIRRNSDLEVCTIHGCYLDPAQKTAIINAALGKGSKISRISLTNCNIRPSDCDLIVRLLSENTALKHLNLMGNQQIGNDGALAFFKCAKFSNKLDLVELRDCKVSYSFVDQRLGSLREVRYDVTL